jgi:hypothetical protein
MAAEHACNAAMSLYPLCRMSFGSTRPRLARQGRSKQQHPSQSFLDRLSNYGQQTASRGERRCNAECAMHASLMTAQGREPLPEVKCCYSGFDGNLPPSKVRCRGESADVSKHRDHTNVPAWRRSTSACSHESLKPSVLNAVCYPPGRPGCPGHRKRRAGQVYHGRQAAIEGRTILREGKYTYLSCLRREGRHHPK